MEDKNSENVENTAAKSLEFAISAYIFSVIFEGKYCEFWRNFPENLVWTNAVPEGHVKRRRQTASQTVCFFNF